MIQVSEAGDADADFIGSDLRIRGWSLVPPSRMAPLLRQVDDGEWSRFAGSWDDLPRDLHMADGGRYRRRRFGCYAVAGACVTAKPHRPHFQQRRHNRLNGGVDRWFEPIGVEAARGACLTGLVDIGRRAFAQLPEAPPAWHVEVHQFRIEASRLAPGQPTPEGRHRDGVIAAMVVMIGRHNVAGGDTSLWTPSGTQIARFCLEAPMEVLFLDDRRLLHEVALIVPTGPGASYRDVLVITFGARDVVH